MSNLIKWNNAKFAIAECKSVDEIKNIRNKAEALRLYAKQAGETLDVQNDIAEIKFRAERRAGGMLKEMDKNLGGQAEHEFYQLHNETTTIPTLDEIGVTKIQSHRWQKIADISEKVFEQHVENKKANHEELTQVDLLKLAETPHISKNSGENEWYTPLNIIESARRVMGSIDTDPASSKIANQIIKAKTFYTKENNGLEKTWKGNVWLNPPYSQPLISYFAESVVSQMLNYSQAIVLVNNATETNWFQKILNVSNSACFVKGRIKYLDETKNPKNTPLQGQVIFYFGECVGGFINEFSKHGICVTKTGLK